MNKLRGGLVALAVTLASLASGVAQASYVLTEVSRPGAATTALFDINNAGVMVGYSAAGTGPADFASGFVFDGTSFTSLTGPAGAISSNALGISDGGRVVGSYSSSSSIDIDGNVILGPSSGYIYQGGSYTTFNVAGAVDTLLRGISPDGRYISGYYSTATQAGVGFVYDTVLGTLATLSKPNSLLTIAQGINSHGIVVGSDILTGPPTTRPGFLYDIATGTRTDQSLAGVLRTAFRSIADDDILAGWFIDALGATHGFVGTVSSYEQIDFVGADSTFVQGSNNDRFLVGSYDIGGNSHAFYAAPVAVAEPGTWSLLVLALGALVRTRVRRRTV